MTQNIYDDPRFFAGYSQLPRSTDGLAGVYEWPALRSLLPDMKDLRVADLGCGFGWFCRWAQENGAAEVFGFDVSEKMLARAKSETSGETVTYVRADLGQLDLPAASFDLAYSGLALHYVENLAPLLATVHRSLVPEGRFVFSIEHPIYMATRRPDWLMDDDGQKSWPVDSYQIEGPRRTNWFADGVIKQHRTVGTTLNLLIGQGFAIRHVEEWGPTDEQVAARPELADERERPKFLLVAAQRMETW